MAEKKQYKIGFSSALSGVEKYHGKAQVDAVKIAFEEAKEEGLNFDLELVIGDDGAETNKAIDVANRFSSDPLVIGVAGPNGSDATKAAAPVYHGAGLPHITFSGSVTDVSNQGYTTFFRLIPNDDAQAEIIIEFMKAGGDKEAPFFKITLTNVLVSSVKPVISPSLGYLTEQVSFEYATIEWTYKEMDPETGEFKGDVVTQWNLETNTAE